MQLGGSGDFTQREGEACEIFIGTICCRRAKNPMIRRRLELKDSAEWFEVNNIHLGKLRRCK